MKGKLAWVVLGAVIVLPVLGLAPTRAPQSASIVIRASRIYTVTKGVVENGAILVEGGKIKSVGQSVETPSNARLFEAAVVIPGLVNAHSHIALDRGSDRASSPAGPIRSEWKAVDHFDPNAPAIPVALSGGVTSAVTTPGSGVISSGQAVAFKLKSDPRQNMILKPVVALKMAMRMLINLRPGETPATEMGWYATAGEQFRRARTYLQATGGSERRRPDNTTTVDPRLEPFVAVLRGDVMVHLHTNYPGEIMTAMHLASEFGFLDRLVLIHAGEVYAVADVVARNKVLSVIGPMYIVRFQGDARSHNVIKDLMDAGGVAGIQTDTSDEQEKCFREYGSFLIRHGLTETQALEALTINGARAMMMADRIGSIEPGKDADLVLMDGPPFDLHAERVERVFVDGIIQFERTETRQSTTLSRVGPFSAMKGTLHGDESTFAITNAQILTVTHGNVTGGTIVVENGKISDVQAGSRPPKGLPTLDVGGRVVTPGWVTAKASPNDWMGDLKWQVQNNENIEPIVPEMSARFAIDPWFPSFAAIREIGITAQQVTPGPLNLTGGSGVAIKTAGTDIEKMVRRDPSSMVFSLTRQSVSSWSRQSQIPVTLETAAAMVRRTLDEARRYAETRHSGAYDQRMEALLPVLERRVPAIVQAHSVDEIRQAMRLASDYKLRLIISGGVEAHALASELAGAGAGVILGNSGSDIGEYESIRGGGRGYSDRSPAVLSKAGVKVSFFGASGSRRCTSTGRLGGEPALNAAWAFRNGTPEDEALKMITLHAADMMGMGERIGSIDVGKDADLLVMEGHPFDYRVLPQIVFVDGRVVFRQDRR